MNARHTARSYQTASARGTLLPAKVKIASGRGAPSAANDDASRDSARPVNPLWMITVGLVVFFGLILLLTIA